MNEIRRPIRAADEIARAREIVSRHQLPEFFTGFEIRLDDIDGQPAIFVVYSEAPYDDSEPLLAQATKRADAYGRVNRVILTALLNEFDDRLPYSLIVEAQRQSA